MLLPSLVLAQDISAQIAASLEGLGAGFPAGEAQGFSDYLSTAQGGVSGDTIGHLLYTRRHFDKAAWFFGADALLDPSDPVSLNNFAAMLAETYNDASDTAPEGWMQAAYAASAAAVVLEADNAAFQNNLGNAARALGLADEAVAAARAASEMAPDEPLYLTNLARALEAAGDDVGAADALARAHALSPNSMVVMFARANLPQSQPYEDAVRRNCNVNFKCQDICPKSIIGGLMSVTCEMENSSAQMACQAGQPHPVAYDCREDIPEYGILIPGLNSGFSVALPGFSMHVVVDGQGNVDTRVEFGVNVGPLGGYVRGDGHYSPSGGVSFDNLGGGV
ncbi:MAG: hypothetical protein GY945_09445, partial [Rhodobacteraceae bacterium]|nr:hypothetical protein [Paracoccaceae bacterium]